MADFAAAQQRIIARRAAREAESEYAAQPSSTPQPARLPSRLQPVLTSSSHLWRALQSPFGTSPSFRVGQLDAELLDAELLSLLSKQVSDALKYFSSHLADDWSGEIGVVLKAILWKLSIWDQSASYGASLQGLKYVDARAEGGAGEATGWQRGVYGLVSVGGGYGWGTLEEWLVRREDEGRGGEWMRRVVGVLGNGYDIAALGSFLVFLYNGRYRTLLDRVLRLRLVPATNQTNREVSFEYLNRQLVWHAFTEFLLFLLPLVGISRWRRWLDKAWKRAVRSISSLRSGSTSELEDDTPKGELAFLPERTCAICYRDQNPTTGQSEQDVISAGANTGIVGSANTDITNPYEAIPCGCIYCFVCIAQRIDGEQGEGWTCLRCGEANVKACKPWSGDVVVNERRETSRQSSGGRSGSGKSKSVMFADDLEEKEEREDKHEDDDEEEGEETMSQLDPMPVGDEEDEGSIGWSRVEDAYERAD